MAKVYARDSNSSLALRESISAPWRKELILEHADVRRGSVSTFENGIDAFENYLRSTDDPKGRALYLSIITGRADTGEVLSAYSREILGKSMDNPPLVPTSASGFLARAPLGRIAVVPSSEIMSGEAKLSNMIIVDERRFPDDGIPRFLWPGDKYIADSLLREWIRTDAGRLAQSGGMNVFFNESDYTFSVASLGDPHGSFSAVDHFVQSIGRIEDPAEYRRAWLAHLESLLDEIVVTTEAIGRALEFESAIEKPGPGTDPLIRDRGALARTMSRLFAFARTADKAFRHLYPHDNSREYDFIYEQIAKINNAVSFPIYCLSFNDLARSDAQVAIGSIVKLMDPADIIEKSYMTERVGKWIDVGFEAGRIVGFDGAPSPALRMLIDEIIYEAGEPDSGPKKRISFTIEGNRITAFDRSGGRAFAPFVESQDKRSRIEELVSRMGAGADVDFIEEDFEDGTRILIAIDITVPRQEDGGGRSGRKGQGFEGIARGPNATSNPSAKEAEDRASGEISQSGVDYSLAVAADVMVDSANLALAGRAVLAAI